MSTHTLLAFVSLDVDKKRIALLSVGLKPLFVCGRQLIELILNNPAVIVRIHFAETSVDGLFVLRSGGGDKFGVIDRAVVVLVASCEAG